MAFNKFGTNNDAYWMKEDEEEDDEDEEKDEDCLPLRNHLGFLPSSFQPYSLFK